MIKHYSPSSGIATFESRYVATAGYDNQVILWDAQSQEALARGVHDHLANQCAFSNNGKLLASSSSDYSVRLWEVPSMRLKTVIAHHSDDVEGLAFHPSKELIASCSRDKTIVVCDFSGNLIIQLTGHTCDVISVAWEGASDTLISSSDDGTIKRWDIHSGDIIEDKDLGGIETDTIAISNEGVIYAGNDEGEILLINGAEVTRVQGHDAGIKRLIYDAAGKALVSLSYDRKLKIWQLVEGQLKFRHEADFPQIIWPRSAAFLTENILVFVSFGSAYGLYDIPRCEWKTEHIAATRGINAVYEFAGSTYTVGDAGIVTKDGEPVLTLPSLCNFFVDCDGHLLTGGQTGEVFNALTGEVLYQHRSPLNCGVKFQRGGKTHVAIGTYTGEALIFSINNLASPSLVNDLKLHDNAIKDMATSEREIFTVCADCSVSFTDIESLTQTKLISNAHDKIINGGAHIAGQDFVSISRDKTMRIWSNHTSEVVETPHINSIKCVAASKDGDMIVSGSYAGHVGVYQRSTGNWIKWQRLSTAGISSVLNTDDDVFLATSYDGEVYKVTAQSNSQSGEMNAAPATIHSPQKFEFSHLRPAFEADGVVPVRAFLPAAELAELRENLARYIRDVVPSLKDGSAIFNDRSKPETLRMLENLTIDPFFQAYGSHPRWVALAEALLGGPVAPAVADAWNPWGWQTWHDCPPQTDFSTPPHQDNSYYRFDPPGLAIWVALEPVCADNGCMRYVRGSHSEPQREHQSGRDLEGFSQKIGALTDNDLAREVHFELEPGDAVVHHGLTIHRTDVNQTSSFRPAFVLIFRLQSAQRSDEGYAQYLAELESHKQAF